RVRHWDVVEVRRRPDARNLLGGKDSSALGENFVDVAVAAMLGQDGEIPDDGVVVVARRRDESDRGAVGQRGDPPPVAWDAVVRQFVLVMPDRGFTRGHPG